MARDGRTSSMEHIFEVDTVDDNEGSVTLTLRRDMIADAAFGLRNTKGRRCETACGALAAILMKTAGFLFHDEQQPVTEEMIASFADTLITADGKEKSLAVA